MEMKSEFADNYKTLGLEPGFTAEELKAAYRDLAKVWHPDRFAHDPRLQNKAQEKLKEINEAYKQLSASRPPRTTNLPHYTHAPHEATHKEKQPLKPNYRSFIAPLLLTTMMLAGLSLYFLNWSRSEAARTAPITGEPLSQDSDERMQAAGKPPEKREPGKPKNSNVALPVNAPANSTNLATSPTSLEPRANVHPMETVTLTIDPSNGLLATSNCPNKTSMTYAKGQEPHQFCTAHNHANELVQSSEHEDKSRLKSFVNRVASPSKWFQKKKDANGNQSP